MNIRDKIISSVASFPTMPMILHKLLQVVGKPEVDANEIAKVVMYDPGLTANLLKAANSAYFGFSKSINSVAEAAFRLGTNWLLQMSMSSLFHSKLNKPAQGYDLSSGDMWRHSAAVGLVSENLARLLKFRDHGLFFTAGVVHDIGKVALGEVAASSFAEIVKLAEDKGLTFEQAETEVLGINHAETGAIILEHWNFPQDIVEAVRWHHDPDGAEATSPVIDMVHIADALCITQGIALGRDDMMYQPSLGSVERMGLTPQIVEQASSGLLDQLDELEMFFETAPPAVTVGR